MTMRIDKENIRTPLCILSLIGVVVQCSGGWVSNDGEAPYGKLSDVLVTPHIDFASRQVHPVKAFVTAYGPGQREVLELKERFGFDPVLFPVKSREWYSPWEEARRKGKPYSAYLDSFDEEEYLVRSEELLRELPSCDAVVIGRTFLEAFPSNVLDRLLARVRNGAGLLYLAPWKDRIEIPGVELNKIDPQKFFPVDAIPSLKGLTCYEGVLGVGRVLEVVYPPSPYQIVAPDVRIDHREGLECLTPDDSDDPLCYDFCLAFVGKCLWRVTGKREDRRSPDGEVRSAIYNANGEETEEGSRSAVLKLTRWMNAKGETTDYDVVPVASPVTISRLNVAFVRDAWKKCEEIRGRIDVPERGDVRVSLTDEIGREIWRKDFQGVKGAVPLSVRIPPFDSRFARVKVSLRAGGHLIDEAFGKLYFNTVAEDRGDFCFSIWSNHASLSRVSRIGLSQFRTIGIDNVMDTSLHGASTFERKKMMPRSIREAGLNVSIYSEWIRGPEGDRRFGMDCREFNGWEDYVRTGSFPAKSARKFYQHNDTPLQDVAEAAAPLGVYFYNVGDENSLSRKGLEGENCFCERCQNRFRCFLKAKYGTLEALNAACRVSFSSWEEIRALPFIEAAKKRRMALWYDFRTFMENQLTDAHRYLIAQIKSKDPEAFCGSEGCVYPASSFTGFRFYDMFPRFEFCAPYFNDRDVHALKYLPPGAVKAAWYGTYEGENTPPFTRRPPWMHLFSGLNGSFWWYAAFEQRGMSFSNCNVFRPDLTVMTNLLASAAEVRTIRESGLAKMLIHASPVIDGVAVHYSNISLHASTIEPGLTSWEISHREFGAALGEASVGYEFLSPPEIEKAGIPSRVKALLLPDSQALTDVECRAMRAFVERGGVLIVDVIPGMLDGNCAYRDVSPLADLFLNEKCVPKRTGRGYAIWLSDYLRGVDVRVGAHSAGGLAAGLMRMLSLGGVRTPAIVTDEAGSLVRAAWFRTSDGALVAGLLGPMSAQSKVKAGGAEAGTKGVGAVGGSALRRFEFDHEVTAFDFAAGGRKIGRGRVFEIALEPDIGRAVAFTENELDSPQLTVSSSGVSPGETLLLSAKTFVGCALFEVRDPDGTVIRRIRALDGKAAFSPAWNEPKGRYSVTVRSAIGGHEDIRQVEVH